MRQSRINAWAKFGSAFVAARRSCSVSGIRYSSNSRIAFSKLLRACAEEVVTGSFVEALFGLARLDFVSPHAAKAENNSRQTHQRRRICPPETIDFLLLIRRAYHAVSACKSYLGYPPNDRF